MALDPTKTLLGDAKIYEKKIIERIKKLNEAHAKPIGKEIGEAYMSAFRKVNGTSFVLNLPKDLIAFLYKYLIENSKNGAAVGLANYSSSELAARGLKDPDFEKPRENENTMVVGIYNDSAGIDPMEINIPDGSIVAIYDDWNTGWPPR